MKHGPIALIEDGLPVVALLAADEVMGKAASNLQEASARGARIILVTEDRATAAVDFADEIVRVPNVDPLRGANPSHRSCSDPCLSHRFRKRHRC